MISSNTINTQVLLSNNNVFNLLIMIKNKAWEVEETTTMKAVVVNGRDSPRQELMEELSGGTVQMGTSMRGEEVKAGDIEFY